MAEPQTYMAAHDCGGWIAVVVNQPDRKKEVAKTVAGFIRDGFSVSLVETADIRSGKHSMCECPRPLKGK